MNKEYHNLFSLILLKRKQKDKWWPVLPTSFLNLQKRGYANFFVFLSCSGLYFYLKQKTEEEYVF